MEKWDLLKLFQEWEEGDKAEWLRGWIQLWYIIKTFITIPIYSQYNNNKLKKELQYDIQKLETIHSLLHFFCM
jgi:hypothetical protein